MQNLILESFKILSDIMENTQFILKNRDKSIPIITYAVLVFFLFIVIRDNLQPEIYMQNSTLFERILFTFIMLSMSFAFFYYMNYMFNKKVVFTQNGIILKKFLRKRIVIEWRLIELIDFKICALDALKFGSFVDFNISDKKFVPNLKKFGKWDISIKTLEKKEKIKLVNVPFSNISEINPIIYSNSNLKYLSCIDLKNPKRPELLWSWNSKGTDEEMQTTLKLLEELPMKIEYNLLYSPELEARNNNFKNYLLINLVVIAPLVYVLILFILDWTKSSNNDPIETTPIIDPSLNIDLIFITFIGISILIISATYWFILPKVMKKYQDKGYNESFFTFFLMFALNDVIVVFGLIIGILTWVINDHVDWLKFSLLGGIGWIQMIYLYRWKIPEDYRKFSFKSLKK